MRSLIRTTIAERRHEIRMVAIGLALVTVAGLVNLPTPFHGDSAFFTLGARDIADGYLLYDDFWDLKQPGIFLFYWLAGTLFGFHEVGIHTFELLYWLGFVVTAWRLLRSKINWRVAIWVPVVTVVVYYMAAGPWHLTQLEILVAFPLLVCMVTAQRATESQHGQMGLLLASALAGGVVLLFKLILAPIPLAFWILALVRFLRKRPGMRKTSVAIGLVALTSVVPLALALGVHHMRGGTEMLHTMFMAPLETLQSGDRATLGRLANSLEWFGRKTFVFCVIAVLGLIVRRRAGLTPLTLGLWLWLVVGVATILIQRTSWWQYHFLLVLTPTVFLAVIGLEALLDRISGNARPVHVVSLLACVAVLTFWPLRSGILVRPPLAIQSLAEGSATAYQEALSPRYAELRDTADRVLESGADLSRVVVLGDPINLYLTGARQHISTNGWALELHSDIRMEKLIMDTIDAVPTLIRIEHYYRPLVETRAPLLETFIRVNYSELTSEDQGTWYRLIER